MMNIAQYASLLKIFHLQKQETMEGFIFCLYCYKHSSLSHSHDNVSWLIESGGEDGDTAASERSRLEGVSS